MVPPLPPPIRRLQVGLHRLPPDADVAAEQLAAGPWCRAAPLWGNPFLTSPLNPDGVDLPFFDFAAAGISSLGPLLHLEQALEAVAGQAAYRLVRVALLGNAYGFDERHVAVARTAALLAELPAGWVAAARAAALALAANRLPQPQPCCPAWAGSGSGSRCVRQGTDQQLGPFWQRRHQHYLEPYAALAVVGAVGPADELLALLRRLWRVRWENQQTKPFWRLVYNAIPSAARLHLDQPCQCGAAAPADRHHHSWECPIAQPVIQVRPPCNGHRRASGPAAASPPALQAHHLGCPRSRRRPQRRLGCRLPVSHCGYGSRPPPHVCPPPRAPTPLHITSSRSAVARF